MASNPQDVVGEAVADYRNRTKTPRVAVALHYRGVDYTLPYGLAIQSPAAEPRSPRTPSSRSGR
jgi:hypothetical protein